MNRKRLFTLIIVMLLSFSMFVSNLAGLNMVVKAADFEDFFSDDDGLYEEPEGGYEETGPSEEELRRMEEEAQEAQRQAEEEARRAAAEEAARQAEEELRKQEEAAKAAEEEAKKAKEEAEKKAAAEEAERQAAYEKAAKEAEEAAKKQAEEDAAAEEAKRQAEEQAKRAQEEAEKAKKAEEEAKKAEKQEYSYAIRTQVGGGSISSICLSSVVGGGDALVFSAVNVGNRDIDLSYGISEASARVFSFSLLSGSGSLKMGDMDKFQIALDPDAPVGRYKCTLFLKDKQDSENRFTTYIDVSAEVTGSAKVTKVVVYPQSIKLSKGGDCGLYAEVQGMHGEVSQDVNWNVVGARSSGTYITGDGVLVIGSNENASSISVVATSVQDPRISGKSTVFVQSDSFNVNAWAEPQNGGIVYGGGAVQRGGSVVLSAVPNKNFYFDGWVRDGRKVSTATNYSIDNIQGNISVKAVFKKNYVNITAVPDNDQAGSVVGGGRISYGGSTTISARAYDGFTFTGWKEGDSIISKSASIDLNNVTVDRKIVAKFAKTKYNISLSCSPFEGGSVTGNGTYKLGDSATIQAKAANGFIFQGWRVNDQTVWLDPTYTISRVDRDYCLTAVFIKAGVVTHNMVAGVATTGGTISPSGSAVVAHGATVTYTITPKAGFAILAVAVDGLQVGPVSSYTFSDIKSDHAIAAAFVQTDAGAKAAKASGNETQTKKVQKVYKEETEENKEDDQQVVDLEKAASGTAGDEYIQEMDLSDITIPTDEELGVVEESIIPETSNVLKKLGISMDEARLWIANGEGKYILESAFYEGSLDTNIDNEYAPPQEKPDYHMMSREELEQLPREDINPSLPNLSSVVEKLITPSEMLSLAEGGTANITVSLRDADNTIDEKSKKVIDGAVGQKPLKYFDLTMMKLVDGMPTNVKELEVPMQIVIRIPDEIYKEGKVYSILRDHNGELTVLPDLDDDPHTITFSTDRFSSYAISEQIATQKSIAIRFAIGALISLIIALTCMLILMYHQIKMKRARRRR